MYSGERDDCVFQADDCCLVITSEKTRLISRDDPIDKKNIHHVLWHLRNIIESGIRLIFSL